MELHNNNREKVSRNIELVEDAPGIQLYLNRLDRIEDTVCITYDGEDPRLPPHLVHSNDKVKLVALVENDEEPNIYLPFSREGGIHISEGIPKFMEVVLNTLNNSGFYSGNERAPLEEKLALLKEARNKYGPLSACIDSELELLRTLDMADGHDTNYAKTNGTTVLGSCANGYRLPIFGVPRNILKKRKDILKHYDRVHYPCRVISNLGNVGEFLHSFRKGHIDEATLDMIIQEVSQEEYEDSSRENIVNAIRGVSDTLGEEIERHESTLEIIKYLESKS